MTQEAYKPQISIYQTFGDEQKIRVRIEDENVWLTQKLIADLFDVDVRTINEHLVNIYLEGELYEKATIRNFRIVQKEALREVSRDVKHYNLDAILAVGYRVRSDRGTQFRKWATERLGEYLIKGFTMDDERLKQGGVKSRYFEELLQRIRDIRSSERNFYQKVTDIYATSIDYKKDDKLTQNFFATVQNKMHFAVHGKTAAELINERVDSKKEFLGLTNFKGDFITTRDIQIAKNYLSEEELKQLNLIVSMYLDFAELQATSGNLMKMKDWIQKLDYFLVGANKKLLKDSGKISHQKAIEKAI
ncbi:MAG: virulence RhuM family protein, partial [Candidatus Gracilibacteria bacterium]|nr:virulence RhuM family protein [Candidatus Gracilibacteria bacterium]